MLKRIALVFVFVGAALAVGNSRPAEAAGTTCRPVGQAYCDVGHEAVVAFLCTSASGYTHLKYFAVASC